MGTEGAIINRLPHREPFVFLTRVMELEAGRRGRGVWALAGDEAFFRGHFPGRPVVPGVLLIEALAQLSGLVGLHMAGVSGGGRLAHAEMRFDGAAEPPVEIELESRMERQFGPLRQFQVSARAAGAVVARGMLTLAETEA